MACALLSLSLVLSRVVSRSSFVSLVCARWPSNGWRTCSTTRATPSGSSVRLRSWDHFTMIGSSNCGISFDPSKRVCVWCVWVCGDGRCVNMCVGGGAGALYMTPEGTGNGHRCCHPPRPPSPAPPNYHPCTCLLFYRGGVILLHNMRYLLTPRFLPLNVRTTLCCPLPRRPTTPLLSQASCRRSSTCTWCST